jgi:hypothetical protein
MGGNNFFLGLFALFGVAVSVGAEGVDPEVYLHPLSMRTQIDAGQIVKGRMLGGLDLSEQFLQHTALWVTQETEIRDRLNIKIGVGGLFWYVVPPGEAGGDAAHKNLTKFLPGISQAEAVYKFGDVDHPFALLQMGYFPYKYNPDAKNLGEYLLRSGTYPGILVTGGWNMLSGANYMVEGFRVNIPLWEGKFQSDFLLPMEHDLPPMYDLSPTYVATLRPFQGLELGAGIDCNHCIAIKPSKTTPNDLGGGYRGNTHFDDPGNEYILRIPNPNPDPDSVRLKPYVLVRDTTRFYTFQGFKVEGRISLDAKAFLPELPLLGNEDLKFYSEVAVLGWKNYPFLYENRWQRMPIMLGFNLPTFKLLDVLSVEGEYYSSKFINSQFQVFTRQIPVWGWPPSPGAATTSNDPNDYDPNASEIRRDNWKWTIYASKSLFRGVRLFGQAASDHLRPVVWDLAGPSPTSTPVTNRNGKDWYYLIRLEFGI